MQTFLFLSFKLRDIFLWSRRYKKKSGTFVIYRRDLDKQELRNLLIIEPGNL